MRDVSILIPILIPIPVPELGPGQSPGRLGFAKGTIERSPGRSARQSLALHVVFRISALEREAEPRITQGVVG